MAQQELNLLKLTTTVVTQLRARSPQIMRCDVLQSHSLATSLYDVPNDILRDALPAYLPRPGDCAEYSPLRNPRCFCPLIEGHFDTFWNRHRADVPALADQIYHCP